MIIYVSYMYIDSVNQMWRKGLQSDLEFSVPSFIVFFSDFCLARFECWRVNFPEHEFSLGKILRCFRLERFSPSSSLSCDLGPAANIPTRNCYLT